MSDDVICEKLAYDFDFSLPTTRKIMELIRHFEEVLPDDQEGQERAFYNAARAAWVQGEPWAQEWAAKVAGVGPWVGSEG